MSLSLSTSPVDLTIDSVGRLVASEGIVYYLTPCCGASVTGSFVGDEPATVCRACYTEVDPWLGNGWAVGDVQSWEMWRRRETRSDTELSAIRRAAGEGRR